MYSFLKTTFLGGVLFLAPVVVLIAIIEKALGWPPHRRASELERATAE
jgi:uncharacterized membrane protein